MPFPARRSKSTAPTPQPSRRSIRLTAWMGHAFTSTATPSPTQIPRHSKSCKALTHATANASVTSTERVYWMGKAVDGANQNMFCVLNANFECSADDQHAYYQQTVIANGRT